MRFAGASHLRNAEDGVPYRMVDRRGDSRIARRPNGAGKIPSPGGRVARVSGSGEECGRKRKSLYNIADLLLGQ